MVVLKESVYNDIVQDIRCYVGLSRNCKEFLEKKYPDLPPFTLGSILSNQWQVRMKNSYRKFNPKHFRMYQKCKENGEPPGILLRLAVQQNIAPFLLATSIMHHIDKDQSVASIKQELKDSSLIKDRDLAYEVYLCNLYDNDYGHIGNVIKQTIGKEYEQRLEFELRKYNIAYIDEHVLRSKGYDKTPDFKLIIPIAVNGFVINWIESKALFGDETTHAGYLKDQLLCYWNRFGPGLVIYWFGYVDTIECSAENNTMIILRHSFPSPENLTFLNPSSIDE